MPRAKSDSPCQVGAVIYGEVRKHALAQCRGVPAPHDIQISTVSVSHKSAFAAWR